jgi:hypothetical protein
MAGLLSVARAGLISVFLPKGMHTRVAMHSLATVSGVAVAVRTWTGDPVTALMWYAGGFVGFHVLMFPFCSLWMVMVGGMQRWVKGIVEEELIRYDLQTYDKQLHRILPADATEPPETRRP